jgi:hypothetical protein
MQHKEVVPGGYGGIPGPVDVRACKALDVRKRKNKSSYEVQVSCMCSCCLTIAVHSNSVAPPKCKCIYQECGETYIPTGGDVSH